MCRIGPVLFRSIGRASLGPIDSDKSINSVADDLGDDRLNDLSPRQLIRIPQHAVTGIVGGVVKTVVEVVEDVANLNIINNLIKEFSTE